MRFATLVLALAMAPLVSAQVITEMTPERIREAIGAGESGQQPDYSWGNGEGLIVGITTPFSRVVAATIEGKRLYKPITLANVPKEIILPRVVVYGDAYIYGFFDSDKLTGPVVDVDAIVIKKPDGAIVQPLTALPRPIQWTNAYGRTREGRGLAATFHVTDLAEGNEIRVVLGAGRKEATFVLRPDFLANIR